MSTSNSWRAGRRRPGEPSGTTSFTPAGCHLPKWVSSNGSTSSGGKSPTTSRVLLPVGTRTRERPRILGRQGLEAVGGADQRRGVAVRRTVDAAARKRAPRWRRDRRARRAACSQALPPHAFELRLRERRSLSHIGHQRQRGGQPSDRHVQAQRRGIDAARCGEIGEQGASSASANSTAEREPAPAVSIADGEARDSESPRRVGGGAGQHQQAHLHDGQFVLLDNPHREPIAQPVLQDHGVPRWWSPAPGVRGAGACPAATARDATRNRWCVSVLFTRVSRA